MRNFRICYLLGGNQKTYDLLADNQDAAIARFKQWHDGKVLLVADLGPIEAKPDWVFHDPDNKC